MRAPVLLTLLICHLQCINIKPVRMSVDMGSASSMLVCYQHWSVSKQSDTDISFYTFICSFFSFLFVKNVFISLKFSSLSFFLFAFHSFASVSLTEHSWIEALMQKALSSDAMCPLPALCHQLSFWCSNPKCCCAVTNTLLFQAAINRAFSCTFVTSLLSLSLPKSPVTNAARTGPENEARWWASHSHQSHCSSVSVCLCGGMWCNVASV